MRKVGVALAVTLGSGIQLFACSSSGPSKVTQLPSDKTLAQLTTEERRQYCEDQFHYMVSRISPEDEQKIYCSKAASDVAAAAVPGDPQAQNLCQQTYNSCRMVPRQPPMSSCDMFASKADGCMVTVGEANQCASAHADALEEIASKADDTCKNVGMPQQSSSDQPSQTPEACARIETLCPMLFAAPGPVSNMFHGWRDIWNW